MDKNITQNNSDNTCQYVPTQSSTHFIDSLLSYYMPLNSIRKKFFKKFTNSPLFLLMIVLLDVIRSMETMVNVPIMTLNYIQKRKDRFKDLNSSKAAMCF